MNVATSISKVFVLNVRSSLFLSFYGKRHFSTCSVILIPSLNYHEESVSVSYLTSILPLSKKIASEILKGQKLNITELQKIINLLKEHNIYESAIAKNNWLLSHSILSLRSKLDILKNVSLGENDLFLLKFPRKKLSYISYKYKNDKKVVINIRNRIDYFKNELEISENETFALAEMYPFILSKQMTKIDQVMKLLITNGIDKKAIQEDMWICLHNPEIMKERIAKIKLHKNAPIKTWMLRCQESILETSLNRWKSNISVLEEKSDLVDYLASRLNCDRNIIQQLNEKNKHLLSTNSSKVKKVLDYLFEQGFEAKEILKCPRIINYNLCTIEHRMNELKKLNFSPTNFRILYCSKKEFNTMVNTLISDLNKGNG